MLVLLAVTLTVIGTHSCSQESAEPRFIRGHNLSFSGIAHGSAASRGERYCTQCHGENLAGGTDKQPSCYTCHGKNWLDNDPQTSVAPGDHVVNNGGFHHHSALLTPAGTCTTCHGASLEGQSTDGLSRPSCLLCHEQKWQ